jgi:hypothetical protein
MGNTTSRLRSRAPLSPIDNKKSLVREEVKQRIDSDTTLHNQEQVSTKPVAKKTAAVQKKLPKDFLWGFATGEYLHYRLIV